MTDSKFKIGDTCYYLNQNDAWQGIIRGFYNGTWRGLKEAFNPGYPYCPGDYHDEKEVNAAIVVMASGTFRTLLIEDLQPEGDTISVYYHARAAFERKIDEQLEQFINLHRPKGV